MRDIPESELEDVFERYGNMVYRLAFAYARSKADADDIFQEVFLRYYRKAWLLRVTINRAKSCLSKMPHEPQETADAAPFSAPESLELHEALLRLAPKYRTVIHLFYYEGYTAEEIGALLHRKPSTVRTQLTRARSRLADLLRDEA